MKMKKRALTLLEIIIVIFLISLITGAIGYSMKGTLDKGRAFRTKQAQEQLQDLLLLCVEGKITIEDVAKKPDYYLKKSGLAKNPDQLLEDGWGNKFVITLNQWKTNFIVHSEALEKYERKTNPSIATSTADEE